MKTRELTKDEAEQLDQCWIDYLDQCEDAQTVEDAIGVWRTYNDAMERMGVIPTLTGYRVVVQR